jgi:hypothetical protein
MTALAGVKSGISYTPSSFQPTTQTFQVLLERELHKKNILPYTSTSTLSLSAANTELAGLFGEMLMYSDHVSTWSNLCKPAAGTVASPTQASGDTPAANPECNLSKVIADLAVAQQMMTGYASLLTASDGSGNTGIVDALRGKALADAMKQGMPSLQVSVAAAGGSTRSNAFFLLSLFYLPKPSFNSGVVATFELRDKNNNLLDAGARTTFFDYNKKWKGNSFDPEKVKNSSSCGAFCAEQ